jgi:hypothetical protein
MLVYVCGRRPVTKTTWVTTESPHPDYAGRGPLEAVEIHLDEFDAVLVAVYSTHEIDRG